MGLFRKDPTRTQGAGTKTYGAGKGQTIKGKFRTQDTGRAFGRGSAKPAKPIRGFGRGV